MTTPRDRVSYGYHTFPFFGLQVGGEAPHPLPVLPIRLRADAGRFGRPFNAVLDTGSTRTLIPRALADRDGLSVTTAESELRVVGGMARGVESKADLAIADAQYPEVTCWEVSECTVIVMRDEDLEVPVLGWDILGLFELILDRRRERISVRLHTG